jgi:hypothetical protein
MFLVLQVQDVTTDGTELQMTQGNRRFQETDKFKSENSVSPVDKNGYYLFPVLQENSCNAASVISNKQS